MPHNRFRVGVVVAFAATVAAMLHTTATAAPPPGATAGLGYLAPYFTEADLTGDDAVDTDDLSILIDALGTTEGDAGWDAVAPADFDDNGVIELSDLATLSSRMIYDDGPFEIVEATALDAQKAMAADVISAVDLTQEYLDRIGAYEDDLNALITVNENALAIAAELDAERESGGPRSMLHGVPVIVKDNYNTVDMPTTAGCVCLELNQTAADSFMVDGLRADGAIILAKANMDEFAFSGSSSESSMGGVSMNPYHRNRSAAGSSGGSGSSIAANFAMLSFGTDTGGSIRNPAVVNQMVGLRPTVGLASRDGIVPLALSQDTGGPMARTVADVAIALDAVVGFDPEDPITANSGSEIPVSYTASLDPDALQGLRIGVDPALAHTHVGATRLFDEALSDLEDLGAEIVVVTGLTEFDREGYPEPVDVRDFTSGSTNEFRNDLEGYLAKFANPAVPYGTLRQIIDSGEFLPSKATAYNTRDAVTPEEYAAHIAQRDIDIAWSKDVMHEALDEHGLDALVYPSAHQAYSSAGNNGRIGPNTGMPSIVVPMGLTIPTDGALESDAGTGLEIMARDFDEDLLLGIAYAYEQATMHRTSPALFGGLD